MVAVFAADQEPGAVGDERGNETGQECKRKAELALGRKCSGSQQHGGGGQGNAELLHQDPGEEQEVSVRKKYVSG